MSAASQRLDKWLWFARFLKSRSMAAELCRQGHIRRNGELADKPAQTVKPGDVLTVPLGNRVLVVRVLDPGQRRGPANEAQTLYEIIPPHESAPAGDGGGAGPS